MKKQIIFLLFILTSINIVAVKRGPGIGSGYSPPVIMGPRPTLASSGLATAQFQENLSAVEINQKGTYTISKPGHYYISDNISFAPVTNPDSTEIIHITSNNVVLDLNGNMLSQAVGNNTLSLIGIKVDANYHHITIRNGTINHFSGNGIYISEGCSNVNIDNMTISNCVQGSLILEGTDAAYIRSFNMSNCLLNHNSGDPSEYGDAVLSYDALGAKFSYVKNFNIRACGFIGNETSGVDQAYGLYMYRCVAGGIIDSTFSLNESTDEAYGLYAKRCALIDIYTSRFAGNRSSDEEGYGLALHGTNNSRIYQCEAIGNSGKNEVAGFWAEGLTESILVGGTPVTTYYGSHYNTFIECESNENAASYGNAYGFYSRGNKSNAFVHSLAQGNLSGTSDSVAAGIYLGNLTLDEELYLETLFTVDHCYIKGNSAENGTGAGVLIDQADNGHIDSNWLLNNTGSMASYGVMDLTTDSSTLIMNNFAFGHTKNYSANYTESNADIPVASASIGDFRPLNVATAFSNIEWRETPNENINS